MKKLSLLLCLITTFASAQVETDANMKTKADYIGTHTFDPARTKTLFYNIIDSKLRILPTYGANQFLINDGTNLLWTSNLTFNNTTRNLLIGSHTVSSTTNNIINGNGNSVTGGGWGIVSGESNTVNGGGGDYIVGGQGNSVTKAGGLTFGFFNINQSPHSFAGGTYSKANNGSFPAFVFGLQGSTGNEVNANSTAVNVSGNTGSQTAGHGSLAPLGVILGGRDHNIPVNSDRSVIIGGDGIKARAAETDQVYVPNLNINTKPTRNDTLNQILARDSVTGKISFVKRSTLGGAGFPAYSGLTDYGVFLALGGLVSKDAGATIELESSYPDGQNLFWLKTTESDPLLLNSSILIMAQTDVAGIKKSAVTMGSTDLTTSETNSLRFDILGKDGEAGTIFQDTRIIPKGIKYHAPYNIADLDDESLITKKHLTDATGGGGSVDTTAFIKTKGTSILTKDVHIIGDSSFYIGRGGVSYFGGNMNGVIDMRARKGIRLSTSSNLDAGDHYVIANMSVDTIATEKGVNFSLSAADGLQVGGWSMNMSEENNYNDFQYAANDLVHSSAAAFKVSAVSDSYLTNYGGNVMSYSHTSGGSDFSQSTDGQILRSTNGTIITSFSAGVKTLVISTPATNDDPTETFYQNRLATTGNAITTIHTIPTTTDNTILVTGLVLARRTGGASGTAGDGAAYKFEGVYKNIGGTVTLIAATVTPIGESQAGWDVTLTISSANVLVRVQGATSNNITWHLSELKVSQVGT